MRKTINIGDLGTIITGKTPPTTNKNYYGDYAVFIKPTDISEHSKYTYETEEMYSKLAAEKYESSLIPKGAICVPCIGTVGTKMTMAPCDCYTNQSINSIICNENYDNEYVYYLIKNFLPGLKAYNLGTASGREYVSKSNFEKIELVAEQDKEIQKKIGVILSRYDSLIENYQKQIKLLEEAAQRLYKEWFVDLHFPGHENTKIVDGVPEGWEKKPALDFFEMSIGRTPPRTQKQWFTKGSNGIPWVSISDMKDTMFVQETAEELTQDACENYNIKVIPKGTILLSFKLTVGRVAFAGADVCTNEAIAHFQKEGDEWKAYTLMYLRNYNYDSLGNTSGISKAVNSTIIKNMPFVMPCTAILQEFSQRVLPFIKQTENLQSQLRLLTEARDRLLPKLMSGELTLEARAEKEDLLATPCKRGWEEDEAK